MSVSKNHDIRTQTCTFLDQVPLFAGHISSLNLNISRNKYLLNNHILKSVELIGIVTNIEQKSDKIIFEIQDGTGFIRCVQYNESWISESYSPLLTLKDRMMIIGTLGCQWDEAQLTVTNIYHLKDFYKNLYCESRKIHLHTRILPNIVKTCECELGSNNNDPLQNDLILGLSGDNYQSFHEWIKLEEKIGDVFDYGDLLSYFKNRNTLINTINDWIYASLVFLRSDGNFQKCWNSDKLKKKEKNQLHKEVLSFIRSENSLVNHRYVWSCLNEKRGVFTTPELVFSILCELCIIYPSRIKRYPENDLFYSSH